MNDVTTPATVQMANPPSARLRTGDILIQMGAITPAQLEVGLVKQKAYLGMGKRLHICEILIRDRFITKEQAAAAIDQVSQGVVSGVFQSLIPMSTCQKLKILPLKVENDVLHVRSAGPLSPRKREAIIGACSKPVKSVHIVATDRVELQAALFQSMSLDMSLVSLVERMKSSDITGVMLKMAIDAIFIEALQARASDIHLDHKADPDSWISYRVDNDLQQKHQIPARIMAAIFTRIKMESGMDASDTRRSQDGRFNYEYRGRLIDFRIASQPVAGGETITMRVLDAESLPDMESLFPSQPEMLHIFRTISEVHGKSGGLVLFSGPTGSGKTTTLYTLAQRFPRDRVNVVTVEDPVEYVLPFARQIQLNQLINQKATDVERSILRQDPDVLIFGEIRDADSARAALKFAESGHLVLATIHAVTAMQTFERFMSFFDEAGKKEALFVMAHYLKLVVNQRLVRRLCGCAVHVDEANISTHKHDLNGTGIVVPSFESARVKHGCVACHGSGYLGRIVAHEMMQIPADEELRIQVAHTLFESQNNFHKLRDFPEVLYQSRPQTLGLLIAAGLIDAITARRILGM